MENVTPGPNESFADEYLNRIFTGNASPEMTITFCVQLRQYDIVSYPFSDPHWYHSVMLTAFKEMGARLIKDNADPKVVEWLRYAQRMTGLYDAYRQATGTQKDIMEVTCIKEYVRTPEKLAT